MSEQIIPDVELTSDVVVAEPAAAEEPAVNYSEMNLAELVKQFEDLVQNEERMKMSKEAGGFLQEASEGEAGCRTCGGACT